MLSKYIRNIKDLDSYTIGEISRQLGYFRDQVVEGILDNGYRLHVLDFKETLKDVPEYGCFMGEKTEDGRDMKNVIACAGGPGPDNKKMFPTVVSKIFTHPKGKDYESCPNGLIHEIGHSLPYLFFDKNDWVNMNVMFIQAKDNGYVEKIPHMYFLTEYFPCGLELATFDEITLPNDRHKIYGPDGRILSEKRDTDSEHLPRNVSVLKKYDPFLLNFSKQFLKEDAVKL